MKQHYCIVNDTVKHNLIEYIRTLPVNPRAPMVVEAREETRTDKQNRLMWPLLKDLSDQVVWHGEKLTREEWKDLITVLVNQTQDQEQNLRRASTVAAFISAYAHLNPASATWSTSSRRFTGSVPTAA